MKLNLGCGYNKLENYINVDHDANCKPDIVADLEEDLPFADNSIDTIVSTECFEHDPEYKESFIKIYKMLKSNGLFCFTCWNILDKVLKRIFLYGVNFIVFLKTKV